MESDIQSERIERVLRDLKSYDIGVEFWYYYAEKCNHNIKDMLTMAVKENRLDPLDADNVLLICNKNGIVWRPDFKEFQSNHEYMVARGTYEANAESARKNWHVENYKP